MRTAVSSLCACLSLANGECPRLGVAVPKELTLLAQGESSVGAAVRDLKAERRKEISGGVMQQ